MRYYFIALLVLVNSLQTFANKPDTLNYYSIGLNAHYGFIIPHSAAIEPVSHTNPAGFEISFNKLSTNYESWRIFNCYSNKGVQLAYFTFQNPDILGSAVLLSAFTEPVLLYRERFIISLKAGAGFSYHTKIFDFHTDTLNKFFSTRVSFPLYLMAKFKYMLTNNLYLTISGSYNHISNGATRVPNYGMNFPTFLMGLEYYKRKLPQLNKLGYKIINDFKPERYLSGQFLTGYLDVYGKLYYAYGFDIRYSWHFKYHYALNAGAEMILDQGLRRKIEIENKSLDYKRFAVTAGQEFIFGRVSFAQYFGLYLYAPYKAKDIVYQKYELSYRILKPLSAGFFLKAHTSDAELCGFFLNYIFWKNKAR
jgi:hypothetical protein